MTEFFSYKIGDLSLVITNKHTDESEIDYIKSMSFGSKFKPSWDEYLDIVPEELHVYLVLIKKSIIEQGWIGKTASEIIDTWNFHFSDGKIINFTNKGWGEMMAAIINRREGYELYYC